MGSPCSHSRQLNGMGGGLSSLSKICILKEGKTRSVVDFTFAQVGIEDDSIDMHGTCGNLMAAVPLFAVEEGLVLPTPGKDGTLSVRVHDVNTSKDVLTHFPGRQGRVDWDDEFVISGVDGTGVRVATEYLNCGGTKTGRLWPTGNKTDKIMINGQHAQVSLVDGPNPAVFCDAETLGLSSPQVSSLAQEKKVLQLLEDVRLQATVTMGISRDLQDAKNFRAIPKICLLQSTSMGDVGIRATTVSMEVPHKAIPITIALSLAIAMATPGSIPHRLATGKRIHHPTGFVDVETTLSGPSGVTATVLRSAKMLMKGEIFL